MKKSQVQYSSAVIQNDDIIDYTSLTFKPSCHILKVDKSAYLKGTYVDELKFKFKNPDLWNAINADDYEQGSISIDDLFVYRLDHEKYFATDGEVHFVAKKEIPMRNRRSLKRIFKDMRQKIAHNYQGGINELFVTLTYAEQTNDPEKVHADFKAFWQRLKRAYKDKELGYISIVEPHGTGMFHIHLLLQEVNGEHLYIPFEDMARIWGQGAVKVERLETVDNIGAYFIAYFSNLEIPEDEVEKYASEGDIEERNGKKYIKGKRLDFYPDGMQIARSSRNMTRPERLENAAADALVASGVRKVYEHVKEIETTDKLGRTRKAEVRTAQYRKDSTT